MSTPKGQKDLWKNIDWKDKNEKKAFFNKYFNGKEFVNTEVSRAVKSFGDSLIIFIEQAVIKEGNKTRNITNEDIIKRIKEQ